jgi:hypothetical protein
MQKPPEIRRLAGILDRRVLEQDGGDDQELAGKGDNARRAGFNDTHFNFLITRAVPLPQRILRFAWLFSTAKVDIAVAFPAIEIR